MRLFPARMGMPLIICQMADMRVFHRKDVEDVLGLDRERLVALALLLGSDYNDGAKNIGPETAMKLLGKDGELDGRDVLERQDDDASVGEICESLIQRKGLTCRIFRDRAQRSSFRQL